MRKDKEIVDQSQFIVSLVNRLNEDIKADVGELSSWSGMKNHCRKQDDIKRVRRELKKLFDLLEPDWRD